MTCVDLSVGIKINYLSNYSNYQNPPAVVAIFHANHFGGIKQCTCMAISGNFVVMVRCWGGTYNDPGIVVVLCLGPLHVVISTAAFVGS